MHHLHKFLLFTALACLGNFMSPAFGSTILNGTEAPKDSMMYMASIRSDGQHICGGFRINDDVVVTAARCMKDMKGRVEVVLGTHDRKSTMSTSKYILEKCKHPSYESSENGYDIMLLKVGGEEGMNVPKKTINLSENKIPENKNCCVAGWGCTKDGGILSQKLKVTDVSINNLKICKTKKWPGLHASCASGYTTKKALCEGDFGGPLVCDGKAAGVASYNKNGNSGHTSVYTDISEFTEWIEKVQKGGWKDCKKKAN